MNSILDAAAELAFFIEQENAALRIHDFSATAKLAELKRQTIERVSAGLRDRTSGTLSAVARKPHGALRERLESALAENKRLLEAAVKVQAEVIAVVLRSIETPAAPQYRLDGTQPAANTQPIAVAMRA